MGPPDKNMTAGSGREFRYPGQIGQYLRQAFVSLSLVLTISLLVVLLAIIVDRFIFNGGYVQPVHFFILAGLVALWGVFSLQMALSLARFSLVVENGTLLVYRGTRSVSIPFSDIISVEIMRNPMWWALRADLRPLKDTARHIW